MSAPEGNQFWKMRSSHGRNPKFETPEALWECCVEYFEWIEDNPLKEEKVFCHQGVITKATISKMRAMTLGGLQIFLDIWNTTWEDYRAKEGFYPVTKTVDEIIRNQKFTGAAADLLNANIIARDLGLVDKQDMRLKGEVTTKQMQVVGVSPNKDTG